MIELVYFEKTKVYPYHLREAGKSETYCGKLRSKVSTLPVDEFVLRNAYYLVCRKCWNIYNLIESL